MPPPHATYLAHGAGPILQEAAEEGIQRGERLVAKLGMEGVQQLAERARLGRMGRRRRNGRCRKGFAVHCCIGGRAPQAGCLPVNEQDMQALCVAKAMLVKGPPAYACQRASLVGFVGQLLAHMPTHQHAHGLWGKRIKVGHGPIVGVQVGEAGAQQPVRIVADGVCVWEVQIGEEQVGGGN